MATKIPEMHILSLNNDGIKILIRTLSHAYDDLAKLRKDEPLPADLDEEDFDYELDSMHTLCELATAATSNIVASNMYYVNVYEMCKRYGGPEEGGWWYDLTDCIAVTGIYCDPKSHLDLKRLYDIFINTCCGNGMEENDLPSYHTVVDELCGLEDIPGCVTVTKHMNGCESAFEMYCIERSPAAQYHMTPEYYC